MSERTHNYRGNCWEIHGKASMNDICPDHDEPRGMCHECPRCKVCDEEMKEQDDNDEFRGFH
jgi:hypothetical protein